MFSVARGHTFLHSLTFTRKEMGRSGISTYQSTRIDAFGVIQKEATSPTVNSSVIQRAADHRDLALECEICLSKAVHYSEKNIDYGYLYHHGRNQ